MFAPLVVARVFAQQCLPLQQLLPVRESILTEPRSGDYYYLMSRFAWVFYLIALFFAVVALFTGLLALCSRIGGYLSGLTSAIAWFFMALAASLMT